MTSPKRLSPSSGHGATAFLPMHTLLSSHPHHPLMSVSVLVTHHHHSPPSPPHICLSLYPLLLIVLLLLCLYHFWNLLLAPRAMITCRHVAQLFLYRYVLLLRVKPSSFAALALCSQRVLAPEVFCPDSDNDVPAPRCTALGAPSDRQVRSLTGGK